MTASLRALLSEPRSRTLHTCHGHHDDDAVAEWERGLSALVPRIDRSVRELTLALQFPREGLIHPEECMRHLRVAAAQVRMIAVCPCVIDEPGSLMCVGASLARVRVSAIVCGSTLVDERARRLLSAETSELRSESLAALRGGLLATTGAAPPQQGVRLCE